MEESRGKEVELATDYVISHTLQSLLESCDLDHLCGFLQSCSKGFPLIATDRSGSHVAETALKSLAMHLLDDESYSLAEKTLNMICKVSRINACLLIGISFSTLCTKGSIDVQTKVCLFLDGYLLSQQVDSCSWMVL